MSGYMTGYIIYLLFLAIIITSQFIAHKKSVGQSNEVKNYIYYISKKKLMKRKKRLEKIYSNGEVTCYEDTFSKEVIFVKENDDKVMITRKGKVQLDPKIAPDVSKPITNNDDSLYKEAKVATSKRIEDEETDITDEEFQKLKPNLLELFYDNSGMHNDSYFINTSNGDILRRSIYNSDPLSFRQGCITVRTYITSYEAMYKAAALENVEGLIYNITQDDIKTLTETNWKTWLEEKKADYEKLCFNEKYLNILKELFKGYGDDKHKITISSTYIKCLSYYEYSEVLIQHGKYIVRDYIIPDRSSPRLDTTEYKLQEEALFHFRIPYEVRYDRDSDNRLIPNEKKVTLEKDYYSMLYKVMEDNGITIVDHINSMINT